jgi:hypothetical protein
VSKNIFGSPAQGTQATAELAHGMYATCDSEKVLVHVLRPRVKQNTPRIVPHLNPHGGGEHEDQVAANMQWWVPC